MPDLYRVFPYDPDAAPHEPGGALHAPRDRQGNGRVDNPGRYGVVYFAASPAAAAAERFQSFAGRRVTPAHLRGGRSGLPLALANVSVRRDDARNLDDPAALQEHALIPSDVATRDRHVTQAWALRLWEAGFPGVRYWSAIEAKWPVIARWSLDDVRVEQVEPLTVFHAALREAAALLGIEIGRSR